MISFGNQWWYNLYIIDMVFKVTDRQIWRNAIEKGSYNSQTDDPVFQKHDISFSEG